MRTMLTRERIEHYRREGHVVVERLQSETEHGAARERAAAVG